MNHLPNQFYLDEFESNIAEERSRLLLHPVYQHLNDLQSTQTFMKSHVFAVWDFMSLLKTLQRQLTCTQTPWLPAADPQLSRFINEIVLGEESDEFEVGSYLSHFELYLKAMAEVGADTNPILHFISQVRLSLNIESLLQENSEGPLLGVCDFMKVTFHVIKKQPHEVAASFLFGREDIIPDMFMRILKRLELLESDRYRFFRYYLERHIQVDGDHHGPLAKKMLMSLCGNSKQKWQEAADAALMSIAARIQLWDFIACDLMRDKSDKSLSHLETI